MTNKQKNFIDDVLKVMNKEIGNAIASATMTVTMADLATNSFDNESADYFFNGVIKVLDEYVELTKNA